MSRVEFNEKTRVWRAHLEHGAVCVMSSDPALGPAHSFQRLAQHQVPICKTARGGRLSWTVRTARLDGSVVADLDAYTTHDLGQGLVLGIAPWPLDQALLLELHTELRVRVHDKTCLYSITTTAPGCAFGPVSRSVLTHFADHIFHCAVEELWAHLVWYPDAATCKLAWHSDSEAGINPHTIMSVTFLDNEVEGVRPFEVRLKKTAVPMTKTKRYTHFEKMFAAARKK